MLELQLAQLAPCLAPESTVVGAAMSKHVHTSTIEAFERFVGATTTSLAKKKARLIFAQPSPGVVATAELEQASATAQYQLEDGTQVASYPGVFSQRRLDQGTALLLKTIPHDVSGVIVDLGCGAGVLGVVAAKRSAAAEVHFVDVSHLAVASAQRTWQLSFGTAREADFSAASDLAAIPDASVQLVVNNPPFHADRAMGDATAWHMFADSKRVLSPGGELFAVGNRHLGYHGKLKRLFGNCEVVATDPKFVVLKARRS
jgi:16S rRNA (guanine1207-N2)-methyltransferase